MSIKAQITMAKKEGNIKAYANVTIDDKFALHDVKVVDTGNGPFVNMPTGKPYEKDGKKVYPDIFHPITAEAREELVNAVIAAYNEELAAEKTA